MGTPQAKDYAAVLGGISVCAALFLGVTGSCDACPTRLTAFAYTLGVRIVLILLFLLSDLAHLLNPKICGKATNSSNPILFTVQGETNGCHRHAGLTTLCALIHAVLLGSGISHVLWLAAMYREGPQYRIS